MSKSSYQIPFNSKGDQLDYGFHACEWRDNEPFEDTLTYQCYSRGRSSAVLKFERSDGTSVSFFMSTFDDLVPHMVNGKVEGRFEFVKKGQNYGCKLLEAA